MYTCIHTCIHAYIHAYVHTHTSCSRNFARIKLLQQRPTFYVFARTRIHTYIRTYTYFMLTQLCSNKTPAAKADTLCSHARAYIHTIHILNALTQLCSNKTPAAKADTQYSHAGAYTPKKCQRASYAAYTQISEALSVFVTTSWRCVHRYVPSYGTCRSRNGRRGMALQLSWPR